MQHPFDAESPNRSELIDLVCQAVDVDAQIRVLQASRDAIFARAYALANREGARAFADASAATTTNGSSVSAPTPRTARSGLTGLPRGSAAHTDRAHRVVRAELASALNLSEWNVGRDISHAVDAVTCCPASHAAQSRGEISEKHVRSIVDAGRIIGHTATVQLGTTLVDADGVPLDAEAAALEIARRYAVYDTAALAQAASLTPNLLTPVAKRIAEKLAGVSFDDRHRVAKRDRSVSLIEQEDGMCDLTARLTSIEAHAIFDRLTQVGKQLQAEDVAAARTCTADATGASTTPAGSSQGGVLSVAAVAAEAFKRPLAEARADSLVSFLLEGQLPPRDSGLVKKTGPRVTARVQVLVPVSLTGRLDAARGAEPLAASQLIGDGWFQPELVGVGPIDTETARRIARDTATWDMIVIADGVGSDIDTMGDILTVDGYRVPADIRRSLVARDEHCRFIGCSLPVYRCDIDHTIPAEDGGPTSTDNLGHLCRGHHVMKHHGGLQLEQDRPGDFTWTLPSGRSYTSRPPSKVTFSSAIGPPDLQALVRESVKRHPFGLHEWDSPDETENDSASARRVHTQNDSSGDPFSGPLD